MKTQAGQDSAGSSKNQIKVYLQKVARLGEEEWTAIASRFQYRSYRKSEFLLMSGQVCQYVYFIKKGLIRRFLEKDGEEISENFFFDNNFGTAYTSFITQTLSKDNLIALEDTEVWQLHFRDLETLCEQLHAFERFVRIMTQRVYVHAQNRMNSFLYDSPEVRYRTLFDVRPKVIERVPQHYIASYIGIKPQSLSRIRKRMSLSKS